MKPLPAPRVSANSGLRYARNFLLLAAAYAAASVLAHTLAMPPTFAAPVWPASGIALVGLLVAGWRLWPAIAAGYAIGACIKVGLDPNAILLSVGPVLQALAGYWFMRRDNRIFEALTDAGVLRTMLLAGPVACAIAPTFGVLVFAAQGVLLPGEYLANWMFWWVGDTLGVLLVAPLALIAMPAGRRLMRRRIAQIALPLSGAAALLLPSMYWFHSNEVAVARQPLELQADLAHEVTRERLHAATLAVDMAARYYAASSDVSAAEFDSFVSQSLHGGVLGLAWLPRVPAAEREEFLDDVRQDAGFENYAIRERSDSGAWVAAGVREEYFPVRFIRTKAGTARTRGFDAASDPVRSAAIERARRSGKPALSAPIRLIPDGVMSALYVVPVYPLNVDPATLDEADRHAAVRGVIIGLLDVQTISGAFAEVQEQATLGFRITDVAAPADAPLAEIDATNSAATVTLRSRDIEVGERTWRIESFAAADYWMAGRSLKSKIFLLATLLSVFLISLHTVSAAARTRAAGLKVAAKARELKDSRRRLSAALSISDVAVWEVDPARDELTLDDKGFRQLRTTAAAEGGYRFNATDWVRRFVHPEDQQDVLQTYAAVAHLQPGQEDVVREFRIVGGDGEVRHLVLHIECEFNDQGRALRVFGSTQDITELKRTELALRESEEYSRSVIEASDDCINVLSLDGRLLEMTPRGLEMMGIEDFESVRDQPYETLWDRDEDRRAAREAIAVAAAGGKARFSGYTSTARGMKKWFDVSATPIPGPDGRPVNLLLVSRDVTEEYEAKEAIRRMNADLESEIERRARALAASERELRAIFDVAGVGIAHIALDERVLRVNPKLCEISGFSEQEFLSQNHTLRTHPEDLERERPLIDGIQSGRANHYTIEKRYIRRDESEIWVRATGSVVRDDNGEPLYRVVIVEDINQSRAERESRLASERRYRELFDCNPMPMWTYDVETLRFTSVNDAAVRHYGYSREEFLSMKLRDIRSPEQIPEFEQVMRLRTAGIAGTHEVGHRKKDGTLITAEVTAHDIVNEGRPARLVLSNDVTDRKRTDALLAGQKRVLERIAAGDSLPDSLDVIVRLAETDCLGLTCSLLLVDPSTGRLRHACAPGLPPDVRRAIDSGALSKPGEFFANLLADTDGLVVQDIAHDPSWTGLHELAVGEDLRACWSLPIRHADGTLLGAFVNYHGEERAPLPAEVRLVESLTHTAAIAISKDIESRKFEESQARFRATFEMGGLGIAHVSSDGRILQANAALTHIIGYSEQELREINPDALVHPDDRDIGTDERCQMWAGEIPRYTVDRRYVCKDGSQVWVRITASAVTNERGEVDYAIALLEDISWRRQAEDSLHRQQEINRLLLENLAEGVVACDEAGQLMLFNKAARDWHGVDVRDLDPKQWDEFFTLYDADGTTRLAQDDLPITRAFRGEPVIDQELTIARHGEAPRTVLASGAQLRDTDGKKRGAVVVLYDVTERRESLEKLERAANELRIANLAVEQERASLAERVAERTQELTAANEELEQSRLVAESASRAKSAFLAVMSHEIRTPMNGIVGMVEVLAQSELGREQVDAVSTIRDSSFSLLRIIDDILDFSKIEAGRLELERVSFDLPETVGGVCDSLVAEAQKKDVDLHLYVDPAVPQRVETDPTRLRQLLYNLIGNAIKFSGGLEDRRGCVDVSVAPDPDAPGSVAFTVRDNGIGIAAEAMRDLFTSFTQAEVSTTRRFGGTGLGLAITRRLVELMNGDISVASEQGQGAEFRVTLPLTVVAEHAINPPDISLQELQCIVVGPNSAACDTLVAYLNRAGAEVHRATDADAARERAAAAADIVVIVRYADEDEEAASVTAAGNTPANIRHLLIYQGARVAPRIAAPHVVTMRGSALRLHELAHAVAVAAGKASPDAVVPTGDALLRGQLVVPTVSQARADGRLILVAEDDPVNQKVILRQLGLLGYAGEVASDGREALQMWRDGSYALLLTDLHMPEMDGYALVEKIRGLEGEGPSLPILALTANALRGEAERAAAAGFDEYLTKPLQLSLLGAVLERWLPAIGAEVDSDTAAAQRLASDVGPAVDTGVLRSIIGDDPVLTRVFLEEYLSSSRALTAELQTAIAGGNLNEVAMLAHRQKSAARAIGASRLGDMCAELENAARAADPRTVHRLLARFEISAARVETDVTAMLRSYGRGPEVAA